MNNSEKKSFLDAVKAQDTQAVLRCLRSGMNPNFSYEKESPLSAAIRIEETEPSMTMVSFLLDVAMASTGFLSDDEYPPIDIAIAKRNLGALSLLLEADCDIEQASSTQRLTPLMVAAKEGNLPAVRLIIEQRPSVLVNRVDADGNSALHHVCMKPYLTSDDETIIEILKGIGADEHLPNKEKHTPVSIRQSIENPQQDNEIRVSGFIVPKYPYIG